jgi:rhodanese-related sulfurtransferase
VAMLGAFWLSRLGVLDLRGVYIPETWLMPQLIGGLLFGAGFVVAGLCPGTSCVSAATGRGDGLAAVGGLFFGVLLTGLAFTPLQRFYESTSRGSFTLPDLLHVPYGVIVFAIVVMALLAFVGLRRLAASAEPSPAMHRALGSVAILLGALAAFAGSPYRETLDVQQLASEVTREEDHVTAIELATWIKDRKPGLRVLDLRSESEFDEYHVPGAENVTLDALLTTNRYASTDTLVLISDGGAHAAQGWVFLRALGYRHVYFLRGGLGEWLDEVMNPAKSTALTRYFGGTPRSATDTQTNSVTNMRRRGC